MNIIEQTSTANTTLLKNRTIKYIVIHYTAGTTSKSGTAKSTAKYFSKETTKASADFIVDDEYVVQFNPDIKNRYCWHAGGSKYNTKGGSLYKIATSANSIGIEVCSTNSTKKVTTPNDSNWYFTDAVIANTTELVKKLMSDYNIDIDHIIRHYDVNGKPCPGIIGWNEDTGDISKWNDFKYNLIPHEIINDTKPTVEPDKTAVDKVTLTVGEVIDAIEAADREPVIEEPIKKEEPKQEVQATTIKSKGLFDIIIELLMSLFKK